MNGKIRVAEILEATTGGTRTYIHLLLTHIDRTRFDVELICAERRNPDFAADLAKFARLGIPVHRVDMVRPIRPVRDLRSYFELVRCLRRRRFDIVHTHSSKAGFLGRLAARRAGIPGVAHTPHAFAFQGSSNRLLRRLYQAAERFAARRMNVLVCVSKSELEIALRCGIVKPNQARVVFNGVDFDEAARYRMPDSGLCRKLGLGRERTVLGTVAEFRPQKGLPDLVRAASRVLERRQDVHFLVLGWGSEQSRLQALVSSAGIADRFTIAKPEGTIWKYYAVMDVFLLTSLWEGLPYTVLEAMAAAKPVVATDVAGTREAVEHETTGLLVPAGDPEAAAEALLRLVDDPALRRRMGEAGRRRVERHFGVRAQVHRVEQVYAALYQETRQPFDQQPFDQGGSP